MDSSAFFERLDYGPLEGRGRQTFEFEASLDYRVSSRTVRDAQTNPVMKNKQNNNKNRANNLKQGPHIALQNLESACAPEEGSNSTKQM